MANSDYYYDLMQTYEREKNNILIKKEKYEYFIKDLENFMVALKPLPDNFEDAEKFYERGGYLVNGLTLSEGLLRDEGNNMSNVIKSLKTLINKTQEKVRIFNSKIESISSNYNTARDNYFCALREESGEK